VWSKRTARAVLEDEACEWFLIFLEVAGGRGQASL
jgi:hypothetical protein